MMVRKSEVFFSSVAQLEAQRMAQRRPRQTPDIHSQYDGESNAQKTK